MLQERAVDREHDDQGRGHVDRHAEDAFERDEEVPDQAREIVAAMGPGRRQVRPQHRIGDEQDSHERHDPAAGAARRLEQQHDEGHAQRHVEVRRRGGAVGEVLPAPDRIDEDCDREHCRDHIPPANAVAKPRGERERQEAQHHHEGDVGVAQRLGGDDVVGGVEMKQRHRHSDDRHADAREAREAVDHPLLGPDIGFRLAQLFLRNRGRIARGPRRFLRHLPLLFARGRLSSATQ